VNVRFARPVIHTKRTSRFGELAVLEPRSAIDASKASPELTVTIVPNVSDKTISSAGNSRFRRASHPSARPWRSVGCLGTLLREVLSSLREA